MRFSVCAALAASLTVGLAAPAFAHAHLRAASPAVGSIVAAAPETVECSFTEALEPRFSALEVRDAAGRQVDSADMRLDANDPRRMIVHVPKLGAGVYTVIWHATSVDTHRTEGRFGFTVAP